MKSLQNYKDAIQNIRLLPEVRQYMEHYALYTSGDWPTWYFQKKLIAQVNIQDSKPGENTVCTIIMIITDYFSLIVDKSTR